MKRTPMIMALFGGMIPLTGTVTLAAAPSPPATGNLLVPLLLLLLLALVGAVVYLLRSRSSAVSTNHEHPFQEAVAESQSIILFLRPEDRTVLYANRAASRFIGLSEKELREKEGEQLFPDLHEPYIEARFAHVREGVEETFVFETMLKRGDQRLLPVEVTVVRVPRSGDASFYSLSCRDLTDQHRSESAFRIIMSGIARETGEQFFRSLGMALLRSLNLTGVGVARIVDHEIGAIETVVLSDQQGALPLWQGDIDQLAVADCIERREPLHVSHESLALSPTDPLIATQPDGIRGVPLFDGEGKVIGLLWIGFVGEWKTHGMEEDILRLFAVRAGAELERLEAVAALNRSKAKYRKLYEWREWILQHSPEGIVHLDADLRFQFISPSMGRILGAPESGSVVIGKRIDEVPPLVESGLATALAELPKGKKISFKQEYTSLYGKKSHIATKAIPIFEEGRFNGAILMVSDVTEIHTTTEALARSEQFLAQAQKLAHVGSFDWNFLSGEIRYSDELYRILGYEPGSVVASPETFLASVHPEDAPRLDQALKDELERRQQLSDTSYRIVRPNGEIRHILARAEYTYNDRGEPTRMMGILNDITDGEQIREALRRAQKLESLGLMAGGVAHDFNNLLVGIIGNISLALDDIAEDDPVHKTVSRSLTSARRAADLANQMLAYSGASGREQAPVSLPPIIEELADLLSAGLPKSVKVDYQLDPATPLIIGDETQLRQVVTNLIMNGAEAIGEREGTVTVSTGGVTVDTTPGDIRFGTDPLPPGEYVYIEVNDTGCGMTPKVLDRIFDPFFTTKFTGRGLGLAAILGIVRLTKGYLGVRSAPDRGATFTVWLPKANRSKSSSRPTPLTVDAQGAESWNGGGVALLVDDEETVRHVAGRILTKAGFAVDTAVDGVDGLERYRQDPNRYRLLIIDMTMPRMDGLTLLKELRKEGCRQPVLISSGYDDKSAGVAFQGLEPLALMRKPYTKEEFLKGVGGLLHAAKESVS